MLRIFELELELLKPKVRKEYLLKTQIKNSQRVENFLMGILDMKVIMLKLKLRKEDL